MENRECVHIRSTCIHPSCKCSECPVVDVTCEEFYKAIDRCYEEAYASGCLAGIELGKKETIEKGKELSKNFFHEMRRMAMKVVEKDGSIAQATADRMVALSDCYTMFNQIWGELEEE